METQLASQRFICLCTETGGSQLSSPKPSKKSKPGPIDAAATLPKVKIEPRDDDDDNNASSTTTGKKRKAGPLTGGGDRSNDEPSTATNSKKRKTGSLTGGDDQSDDEQSTARRAKQQGADKKWSPKRQGNNMMKLLDDNWAELEKRNAPKPRGKRQTVALENKPLAELIDLQTKIFVECIKDGAVPATQTTKLISRLRNEGFLPYPDKMRKVLDSWVAHEYTTAHASVIRDVKREAANNKPVKNEDGEVSEDGAGDKGKKGKKGKTGKKGKKT